MLVGDDRQDVGLLIEDAAPGLVNAKADAAANLLALAHFGDRLVEGANLEHVGIVPPFAQGRVGEDEAHRLVEGEEALLVAHDELVGLFVLLGFAGAAVEEVNASVAPLLLGEVRGAKVSGALVAPFLVPGGEALKALVEGAANQAVIIGVACDAVNEE